MRSSKTTPGRRPYSLGHRQQQSDRKRANIVAIARAQLESNGFVNFSLESIAHHSGVTRQTIYNLFGTRTGLLEALFDQLAVSGGMERMRSVMQQTDPETALASFVDVFCGFWSKDRLLIRRIHGIAALDPEFGAAVDARNRRRQAAAARIVSLLDRASDQTSAPHSVRNIAPNAAGNVFPHSEGNTARNAAPNISQDQSQRAITLWALTSFEFFDALSEASGSTEEGTRLVQSQVRKSLLP